MPPESRVRKGSGRFTVKAGACGGNRHGWAGLPRRQEISRGKGRETGEASRYRREVRCESLMAKRGAIPRLPFAVCVCQFLNGRTYFCSCKVCGLVARALPLMTKDGSVSTL